MEREKHYRLSHFVPDGYPQVYPGSSAEVKAMMPDLIEKVTLEWTAIPKYDLEIFATRKFDVPCLVFRKNGEDVYFHVFCNEFMDPVDAFYIVLQFYNKFELGQPGFAPEELNWIHTIPIPGPALNESETLIIHQLTQSFFWTIYMDYKREVELGGRS